MIARRSFLRGLVNIVAAPAIVRASSLMPVRGISLTDKMAPDDALPRWVFIHTDYDDGAYLTSADYVGQLRSLINKMSLPLIRAGIAKDLMERHYEPRSVA